MSDLSLLKCFMHWHESEQKSSCISDLPELISDYFRVAENIVIVRNELSCAECGARIEALGPNMVNKFLSDHNDCEGR